MDGLRKKTIRLKGVDCKLTIGVNGRRRNFMPTPHYVGKYVITTKIKTFGLISTKLTQFFEQ